MSELKSIKNGNALNVEQKRDLGAAKVAASSAHNFLNDAEVSLQNSDLNYEKIIAAAQAAKKIAKSSTPKEIADAGGQELLDYLNGNEFSIACVRIKKGQLERRRLINLWSKTVASANTQLSDAFTRLSDMTTLAKSTDNLLHVYETDVGKFDGSDRGKIAKLEKEASAVFMKVLGQGMKSTEGSLPKWLRFLKSNKT